MKTPTIKDVNDIGCCCPYPECPGNRWKTWDREAQPYNYLFVPFLKPAEDGDGNPLGPTDLIPTLYDSATNDNFTGHEGMAVWYEGWQVNPTNSANKAELRQSVTMSYDPLSYEPINGWIGTAAIQKQYNEITDPATTATYGEENTGTSDPTQIFDINFTHQFSVLADDAYDFSAADHTEVAEPEKWVVEAEKWEHYPDKMRYYTDAGPETLQGWPGDFDVFSYHFDISVTTMEQIKLVGPLDLEGFIGDCMIDLSLVAWPVTIGTDQPESVTYVWSRRYFPGGSYNDEAHWPWIEDAEDWPVGPNFGMTTQYDRPVEFRVEGELTGVKYQVGIPESWETANAAWFAWKALHDAWEAAPPETRGEEPAKPAEGKRSTFECQWQEVFFPQKWEEWRVAHGIWQENHAEWVIDHATWEEADPETRGDEPEEPTEPVQTIPKPTDPEDLPTLVQDREWSYGGPGTPAFSDEFEMPPPPKPGKVRPVNMLIVCYHSNVGTKPSLHGEFINLDNP